MTRDTRETADVAYKAVLAVAAASLSVTTWLIQMNVSDIRTSIERLNGTVVTLQISQASELGMVESHERRLTAVEDKLESRLNRSN